MTSRVTPADTPRTTSLRTRWQRAFAAITFVLVLGGLASVVGTALVVDTFHDSAMQVERDATTSAELRADLIAYSLTFASQPDSPRLALLEASVRNGFARALADERSSPRLLQAAIAEWQAIVDAGGAAPGADGTAVRAEVLTSRAPTMMRLLDKAGAASRAKARADLADAARQERLAIAAIRIFGLISLVVFVRLVRRLSTQVFTPVAKLRDSANHLAAGDLDHRVVVDRSDELGELAVAFNAMADVIAGSQRSLTRAANHDSLTGLANRAAFHIGLEAALARPERRGGSQAVLFVDLDDFKDVNDTQGHLAGDELLVAVAQRLRDAVRPGDLVARLGGDEFALLLDGIADSSVAMATAERIVAVLAAPITIGGRSAHVGASVGLAMRHAESTVESLTHEADVAMYAAKGKGKNRVERYDADLDDMAADRHSLAADMNGAADRDELRLDYQPVVNLDTGAVVGLEALVRWHHPTRGLLQPLEFIALAEETGAIISIGSWVLRTAAAQLRDWQRDHELADLWMSVNVSVCQLDAPGFADEVDAVLRETEVEPSRLVLEVTESVLADRSGGAAAALAAIRAPGVRVALDDFGAGYSSIAYLRDLPVDALKIDRSFISGPSAIGRGQALLEAIVAMAHRLGLDVIPEGIEEIDQLEHLRVMGCQIGQGFLLSRPLAAEAIGLLLALPEPCRPLGPAEAVA